MHVYKIKTQSKENCTEQHYEFQSIESWQYSWLLPLWREEMRSSTFAGFSFLLLIFLCNGAGLRRRDTESEELLTRRHRGEECRRTSPPPPHIPLLPSLPPGPSQCVLRSFASRLGYRAWMSWLMDTKQRCPWWWRELGKLESIPAFNTHTRAPPHTHTPVVQLFLSISSCLTVSVSVCSQSA